MPRVCAMRCSAHQLAARIENCLTRQKVDRPSIRHPLAPWLSEPTTGVYQFGGGSPSIDRPPSATISGSLDHVLPTTAAAVCGRCEPMPSGEGENSAAVRRIRLVGADFDALSITGLEPMIAERYIWPARERQEALLRTCNRRTEQECCA